MISVIIAGGSGTRLWPLSTSTKPKQLLALTNKRTMIQNTYERSKSIAHDIYIMPEQSLIPELRQQLPEVNNSHYIAEPGRRGTANCVVAALAYISKRHHKDEPIAFYWADHHIRDVKGFARAFTIAAEASIATNLVALIGIEPTYAATVFGYIEKGNELSDHEGVFSVEQFKEKPDLELANEFVASGNYLWNCGYMVGSVNTFVQQFNMYAPELKKRYDELVNLDETSRLYAQTYLSYESDAIDYAFNERVRDFLVVPATFDWVDVGNFKDLHDTNEKDEAGNYQSGENIHTIDIESSYIRNEETKPVAVIGLDNVIVVNTPDGILVSRKDVSPKVGDIAKKIQSSIL